MVCTLAYRLCTHNPVHERASDASLAQWIDWNVAELERRAKVTHRYHVEVGDGGAERLERLARGHWYE